MKVKKPIQTKFRMPVFNWVALKPSQIDGTVFTELNDEKVLQVSDGDKGLGTGSMGGSVPQAMLRWPRAHPAPTHGVTGLQEELEVRKTP